MIRLLEKVPVINNVMKTDSRLNAVICLDGVFVFYMQLMKYSSLKVQG